MTHVLSTHGVQSKDGLEEAGMSKKTLLFYLHNSPDVQPLDLRNQLAFDGSLGHKYKSPTMQLEQTFVAVADFIREHHGEKIILPSLIPLPLFQKYGYTVPGSGEARVTIYEIAEKRRLKFACLVKDLNSQTKVTMKVQTLLAMSFYAGQGYPGFEFIPKLLTCTVSREGHFNVDVTGVGPKVMSFLEGNHSGAVIQSYSYTCDAVQGMYDFVNRTEHCIRDFGAHSLRESTREGERGVPLKAPCSVKAITMHCTPINDDFDMENPYYPTRFNTSKVAKDVVARRAAYCPVFCQAKLICDPEGVFKFYEHWDRNRAQGDTGSYFRKCLEKNKKVLILKYSPFLRTMIELE